MKIVHLANHARNSGNGIVNMMVDLACTQAAAGHDVTIASGGGNYEDLLKQRGVRHLSLPQSGKPWRVPMMLLGFRRLLKMCNPDIVHAHMTSGALIARFGAIRRRYALVTTVHNEFQKSALLMGVGDRVVSVSKAVAASMARRGVPAQRLSIVRNGTIGTLRFANAPIPPSPDLTRPSIVTVAGLYERKGINDLLRAFASLVDRFPTAALYLVGDGPGRAAMEALAKELGIADRAHFAGFVANPRAHLAEADVFVLASHKEAAGLVLSEAREAGCVIVATDVDGIPEMLDDGKAGLLVPPRSPQDLARGIELLLTNGEVRTALIQHSNESLSTFHVKQVCDSYLSIYKQAIDGRDFRSRRSRREVSLPPNHQ
jgi:glycosyltransferase involved in cell wall biosynthesis